MPSTSAKQHRFMQAVAHSPSFAKKAGVSQSVGKDFFAADKGRTFSKGGTMKKGKRFNGEDGESEVEYHDYDPDKTYSGRSFDDDTGALAENTPTRSTAKAASTAPSRAASAPARTAPAAPSRAASAPARTAPAAFTSRRITNDVEAAEARAEGRSSDIEDYIRPISTFRPVPTDADAEKARAQRRSSGIEDYIPPKATAQQGRYNRQKTARQREEGMISEDDAKRNLSIAAMAIPGVGVAARGINAVRGINAIREAFKAANRNDRNVVAMERNSMFGSKDAARKYAESGGMKRGGGISRFAKGGTIMESKKMVGKEVAFMKKKGAPSSMIKHEKAEMGMKAGGMARGGMPPEVMAAMMAKRQQPMRRPPPGGMPPPAQPPMGMKKGGVAKFAKGGGIESRGKTKGTVIRMAAGGSVSSRADGIAQRGKTKFTNY